MTPVSTQRLSNVGPALILVSVVMGLAPWPWGLPSARAQSLGPAGGGATIVAASGQPAPNGGVFNQFDVAHQPITAPVNANGQVAFFASLLRGPAEEGFFLYSQGRIARLAAVGDEVGAAGSLGGFAKHPVPSLNGRGEIAFTASLIGGRSTQGAFVAGQGAVRAVALAGQPAPGIPGGTLLEFDDVSLNDAGQVAFLASVRRGRDQSDAIFLGDAAGPLIRMTAAGEPAPSGGSFGAFGPPTVNGKGAVAFAATVEQGPWVGGVYVLGDGTGRIIAGAGQPSPLGGIFAKFSERVALNERGQVAFIAMLKNARTPAAVFMADGEALVPLAEQGSAAPGGGQYADFGPWAAIDGRGRVAFVASLDNAPSAFAVFLVGRGGGQRVVGVGQELGGGRRLGAFPLYPVVAASADGRLTFAGLSAAAPGAQALFVTPPLP